MCKISQFLECFPSIKFDVQENQIKSQLSLETISTGEREIQNMLQRATQDFNQAKKDHKRGKISSEELFDYEWEVEELKQELKKFQESNNDNLDNLLNL